MKRVLKRLLGEERLGFLDYYRFPEQRKSWGGPFNGQEQRLKIVRALLSLTPDFVVETGTFRGTSTALLAREASCPVITVENDARSFGFARASLRRFGNVEIVRSDSRVAIRKLMERPQLDGSKLAFFYLDAHWGADLPLLDELDLVFSHWRRAMVLVDDFQVADDLGYGYDDYGPGKALTLEYTSTVQTQHRMKVYFPRAPSHQETGAQRGCALFVADDEIAARINGISELRTYPSQ